MTIGPMKMFRLEHETISWSSKPRMYALRTYFSFKANIGGGRKMKHFILHVQFHCLVN